MSADTLSERLRAGLLHHSSQIVEFPDRRRTFAELARAVEWFACALDRLGIEPGHRVAIQGANCFEWVAADLALMRIGAVSVALPEDARLEGAEALAARYRLSLWLGTTEARSRYPEARSFMSTFDDLLAGRGERRRTPVDPGERTDSDRLGIIHSSGTSNRKAMWVSERGTSRFIEVFMARYRVDASDRLIVFMPLASYQQRKMVYGSILSGAQVVFSRPMSLFSAFSASGPTIVIGPPALFESAEAMARTGAPESEDKVRLGRVFGGRARLLLSGMAKIQPATVSFYHQEGLPLYEVYGLNESGVVAGNHRDAHRPGSVGTPLDGTRVRIADDGEIVVEKDWPVCTSYFERPDDQEDTRIEGSTVYTGDLGRLDDDGFLFVTGRKKTTLVLRDGRKIQPEPIEKELTRIEEVDHAVLFANPERTGIVVVVDLRGAPDGQLLERVRAIADEWAGGGFLEVRVARSHFSVENGCLSRVLKVNRSRVWQQLAVESFR
jgi:long-subunit acyl-CoA synthetase (AMP-forming)